MKNERLLLYVLAAAMFTHIMDFMIIMPLGPQLMRLFDITAQQFSLLVASYTITAGVSGFFAAFFIDRYDRKKSLILVYAGFAIGTLACALSPTFIVLLLTRSLTGAFGGVLGALILSIVSDAIPLERRAQGIGVVMASFGVASVFGVPFGLFLASKFSWHAPFLFLGGIAMIVTLLIIAWIPVMTKHLSGNGHASPIEVLRQIFGRPNARLGLTFTSVLMLGHFTIIPFVATYFVGNVGFSEDELTYIYLVLHACVFAVGRKNGGQTRQAQDLYNFWLIGYHTYSHHHESDTGAFAGRPQHKRYVFHLQQWPNGSLHNDGNRHHQAGNTRKLYEHPFFGATTNVGAGGIYRGADHHGTTLSV
jgi:predicted MFS family arabinose efflux permease